MSAFLMSPEDLAAIAREISRTAGFDPAPVFDMLLSENLASLEYRYPGEGKISDWYDILDGGGSAESLFTFEHIPETPHTAVQLRDIVKSYQYQSCEHPEWEESTAYRATELLLAVLEPRAKAEEAAEAAKVAARRAALAKLPSLYPKETAKAIRKLLRAHFPATTFRVTTGRGSMVSSVDIRWTDGPTTKTVDALVSCFEAGRFDGMTDSYDYDQDSAIVIDGTAYRPACRFVHTSREISAQLANRCIRQVAAYWGATEIPVAVPTTYGGYTIGHFTSARPKPELPYYWTDYIHQAAQDRTRFQREG